MDDMGGGEGEEERRATIPRAVSGNDASLPLTTRAGGEPAVAVVRRYAEVI